MSTRQSTRQVNGDVPTANQSAFLQHFTSYPVVEDGITTFKENSLGQRSIQLSDQAYKTLAPILGYLNKPYEYVSPYVRSADNFGDQTLSKIDERFPIIKKPTAEIYNDTKGLVLLPYHKGLEGRDHVFQVWSNEVSKNEPKNLVNYGKSAVGTALIVSTETLGWLSSFMSAKKAEATETINEKVNN